MLRAEFAPAPSVKIMINIGATLDIPTGKYHRGRHGESVLNGGLAFLTGIVGIGNNFKSTVMRYMSFMGLARIPKSTGNTYDTEVSVHENRMKKLASFIRELGGEDIIDTGRWMVTDKTVYFGNEYYEIYKDFLKNKKKNAEKNMVETPFMERNNQSLMKIIQPTFTEIDSFTEFETEDVAKMQDANELGESGGNTIHMRQGLAKLRFLMEAPGLNGGSYNYLLMTAHIGKESTMQNAGPGGSVPIQKLKHLKNGDKIKGTTDKFTFITHNCWHSFNASPFTNDGTKGPEYPRSPDDNMRLDTDLNTVQIRNLRGKSGPSGLPLTLLVSQEEGVLGSLTEYHHLKEVGKYFGMGGSNISHYPELYPDCKIGRTTVRSKIDSDPKLRRALNIMVEMLQMSYLWHDLPEGLLCDPKVLYEDLKAKGYDWDMILEQTRGWWTLDNDKPNPLLFLSTMDLLNMRQGKYHPFWLEEDKKTIKAEYRPKTLTEVLKEETKALEDNASNIVSLVEKKLDDARIAAIKSRKAA